MSSQTLSITMPDIARLIENLALTPDELCQLNLALYNFSPYNNDGIIDGYVHQVNLNGEYYGKVYILEDNVIKPEIFASTQNGEYITYPRLQKNYRYLHIDDNGNTYFTHGTTFTKIYDQNVTIIY